MHTPWFYLTWRNGRLEDLSLRFGKWFRRSERNSRGDTECREQGQAVIIVVDYAGPCAERAGFWCLSGHTCSMDFNRMNNQEAGEEETQQQEKVDLVGHLLHTSVSTRLFLPVRIFPHKVDSSV